MSNSEKLNIVCPCCETRLQVDKKTGEIIWEEKKQKVAPSLTDMVKGLKAQQQEQESAFKKQAEIQKERARLLDEKFKESQKKVDKSDDTKPIRDFDLD